LRNLVEDLLNKGVVRRRYSQYAILAFVVPKLHGSHRIVVDYCLLKKKLVFIRPRCFQCSA
jgi:hypothetical protein